MVAGVHEHERRPSYRRALADRFAGDAGVRGRTEEERDTEIAAILDAPVGTVKGRMRLGLDKLRRQLVGFAEEAS